MNEPKRNPSDVMFGMLSGKTQNDRLRADNARLRAVNVLLVEACEAVEKWFSERAAYHEFVGIRTPPRNLVTAALAAAKEESI
jgi:hypothetical protein